MNVNLILEMVFWKIKVDFIGYDFLKEYATQFDKRLFIEDNIENNFTGFFFLIIPELNNLLLYYKKFREPFIFLKMIYVNNLSRINLYLINSFYFLEYNGL